MSCIDDVPKICKDEVGDAGIATIRNAKDFEFGVGKSCYVLGCKTEECLANITDTDHVGQKANIFKTDVIYLLTLFIGQPRACCCLEF